MDLPWSLAAILHNEGWYMELGVYSQIKNGLSGNHSVVALNPIRLIIGVLASHLWGEDRGQDKGKRKSCSDCIKLQSDVSLQLGTPS